MRKKVLLLITVFLTFLLLFSACTSLLHNNPEIDVPDTTQSESKSVLALGNLNIRSAPTTAEDNIIGLLSRNSTAEYLGNYDDKWYIISFNGKQGYVSSSNSYSRLITAASENTETSPSPNSIIENIIQAGMDVMGTPYEYGATRILNEYGEENPYFTGDTFDCSSFVQYAFYIGGGIKLDGDSRSQSDDGELIALSDIKRGDIILMTNSSRLFNTGIERIGHVGIYLGNNKLLHTYGDGGVRITDFSPNWEINFITARRMI
jgi:cell wall-associated NlpC family hydrolase